MLKKFLDLCFHPSLIQFCCHHKTDHTHCYTSEMCFHLSYGAVRGISGQTPSTPDTVRLFDAASQTVRILVSAGSNFPILSS